MPLVLIFFANVALLIMTLWAMRRLRRMQALSLVATFITRQLPLEPSLRSIAAAGSGDEAEDLLDRLSTNLARGLSLAESLRAGGVLSAGQAAALRCAESRGAAAQALREMAEQARPNAERLLTFEKMMFYPLLVAVPLLCSVAFIEVFIVPKFEQLFMEMQSKPGPLEFTGYSLIAVIGLVCWGLVLMSLGMRSGRWIWCRVPVLGTHFHMQEQSSLARHLGLMLGAGATLEQAIDEMTSANAGGIMQRHLTAIRSDLGSGVAPVEAFRKHGNWREEFLWALEAVALGAQPAMVFTQIAEVLEDKFERRFKLIDRIGTPLSIIIAASAVALLAWSLFGSVVELQRSFL
ncbi:MAG TPA: type II secretion system F family protein [Planctomycetota bacterium]|nr:type II secretion system F family protein [Planctomycetota bacterium]